MEEQRVNFSDYETLIQLKRRQESQRNTKYKHDSRERLKKIVSQKIRTTMIGALSTIEKKFGFLWLQSVDDDSKIGEKRLAMQKLYEETREEILDNGNNQIRNIITEIDQYEVEWQRYTLNLPIKSKEL